MRLLLMGVMIVSFGAMAHADSADFERGFDAGKLTCSPVAEAWSCFLPDAVQAKCTDGTYKISEPRGAASRASALLDLLKFWVNFPKCLGAINAGQATCVQL